MFGKLENHLVACYHRATASFGTPSLFGEIFTLLIGVKIFLLLFCKAIKAPGEERGTIKLVIQESLCFFCEVHQLFFESNVPFSTLIELTTSPAHTFLERSA